MIHIERRKLDHSAKKNEGNNPKMECDKDLDYNTEIAKTYLTKWKDVLNYPILFEYEFTKDERETLLDAAKIGVITKRPSSLHAEELEEIIKRLESAMKNIKEEPDGWFVRFDGASPKDGKRDFPLMTAREIIEQIATSWRAMTCLDRQQKLYFCKFLKDWTGQESYESSFTRVM